MDLAALRRRLLPVLAVLVALELAAAGVGLVYPHRGNRHPPATASATTPSPAARPTVPIRPARAEPRLATVRHLLAVRARAVLRHDRAAFLATVDPAGGAFRGQQSRLVEDLRAVPLTTWRYDVSAADALPVGGPLRRRYHDPVWASRVELVYGLRGVDAHPTARPQFLTFVERHGRWYLGGDDDFAASGRTSWHGLWDDGPVVVARGRSCLVLAHPRHAADLAGFVAAVDAAVPQVSAIWGRDWSRRVAVLIPDTQREMRQLVGGRMELAHIAAVATADEVDEPHHVARGQRVVLNPANLASLGAIARSVVLRHELTHVATRADTGPATPVWLAEGFADFVGYRETDVSVDVAAADLRADVERGRVPSALPGDAAFDGANPRLSQAYEEAWMACRLIARRAGLPGLVRLYRLVGAATGDPTGALTAALRTVIGMSYDGFVAAWRHDLIRELG